ncbi:MAG: chemotaxis protein CheW [Gammaproteobacteria bacterium]|nr:chemotaxis protein CheW [Gammaproteobacteria bacterium]
MSSNTKEKKLSAQSDAVMDYLNVLLQETQADESISAARAAENIAGLVGAGRNHQVEESAELSASPQHLGIPEAVAHDLEMHEAQSDESDLLESEQLEIENDDIDGYRFSDDEVEDNDNEDDRSTVEYRDCSDDPEVIAEAEKMLSYAITRDDELDDTPLAKLRRAGVIEAKSPVTAPKPIIFETTQQIIPNYASDRFSMMRFRVAQMQLMISVTELENIDKPNRELTPVAGAAPWIFEYNRPGKGRALVVDGSRLFIPQSMHALRVAATEQFIIWLKGVAVGILCDEVQDMVEINQRQVTWRGSKEESPWMAGNVRSMRTFLLDGQGLLEMMGQQLEIPR